MELITHDTLQASVLLLLGLLVFYPVFQVVYNVYFHPLRQFPGPWVNKISILPHLWTLFQGKQSYELLRLHTRYGHVVRYGPNELSFSSAQAWKDIYGSRPGHQTFTKSTWYDGLSLFTAQNIGSIISERDPGKHAAMSRMYGGAFSRGFLNEMEPKITEYLDRFIEHVRTKTAGGVVDLTSGYSSLTFDIIGDLAFGQDFAATGTATPHRFIRELTESLGLANLVEAIRRFPALGPIARVLFRGTVARLEGMVRASGEFALGVIRKRIAEQATTTRKDLLTKVLAQRAGAAEKIGVSEMQLAAQSWDFIGAGSETTAAALTFTTYALLRDQELLAQVTAEVRAAFPDASAITNAAAEDLDLLHRVCLEGLRLPTSVPLLLPRLAPQGGGMVDGHFIPGGTQVGVSPMVTALAPANFKDPLSFKPERWLGKHGDVLQASQPFSLGPRGCAGKHVAWMELRVTLAKLLYTFDLELEDPDLDWIGEDFRNLPQYALWVRPSLNVKARVAVH